jgi:heat shock protein HslJ
MLRFCFLFSLGVALGGCSQKTMEATGTDAAGATASAPKAAADPTRLGGTWTVTTLNGAAVPASETDRLAQLIFDTATGRLSGFTSCNRLMGSYTVSGNVLSFNQVATTRMACTGPNVEQQILAVLNTPGLTYQLSTDNQLTLLSSTVPVAVLTRAAP